MAEGRREANRARMRARLLTAALKLFGERGYEGTTIDDIAAEADVARQTVLNHYPHKRDFLREWGQDRRDRLLAVSDSDEPARIRLHRYFTALAAMNERERTLTRMLHVSLRQDEVAAHQHPVPEATVEAISQGQERGELRADLPPRTVAEVVTAIYGDTLRRWLTGGPPPFDLAAALAERLDLLMDGLTTG
ncbi:TetR/AcrR family transcriptional regulator [Amycolatopsis sp. PS_44_ISF1]|uniref:TetR/AcrR family transcriptional regulator n=1 Tax=Amycolatopsis sp. PS_44_ISF1 TaxID=2974917 RepID=UPI0028DD58DB|nr:TetR/AcrR family transcriptional regulator [Amycolatopsis sp. PS_44_ISF1]MDT8914469.1 TetR/AcrR family transcriptional regulator [Amycolatopsis sp. PS_44_ISF1]